MSFVAATFGNGQGYRLWAWFLLLCLAMYSGSAAASAVTLDADVTSVDLSSALTYFVDDSGTLTIDDVSSAGVADHFKPLADRRANFGITQSVYWVRVDLNHMSAEPDHWIIELAYSHLRDVRFYERSEAGYVVRYAGYAVPFGDREIKYRNSAFPVRMGAGEAKTVYLRLASDGAMMFPLKLWHPRTFRQAKFSELIILGAYFGVILALFLYNAFLYASLRDRSYLYYVLYLAAMALVVTSITGVGFEYLWPESPAFGYYSPALFTGFLFLFLALFSRSFLCTSVTVPWIDKVLRWVAWYWAVTTLPLLFVHIYYFPVYLAFQSATVVSVLIVFVTGCMAWRGGFKAARFYVISFLALIVCAVSYTLRNLGWVSYNPASSYGLLVGSAIEMLLLSTALADRINILKRDKEEAQAEVARNQRQSMALLERTNASLQAEIERRHVVERSLFESREKYRVLFETLPVAVMVTDDRGRILESNDLSRQLFEGAGHVSGGRSCRLVNAGGKPLRKRDWPAFRILWEQVLVDDMEVGIARQGMLGGSGAQRWLNVVGAPLHVDGYGAIIVCSDITERKTSELKRKRQESELARASRLTSMGEMASTLAHELTQPLNSSLNYLYGVNARLQMPPADPEELKNGILQSIRQIERAGNVIGHVKEFSRHHTPESQSIDLDALIRDMVSFLEFELHRHEVSVRFHIQKDLPPVNADKLEIEQVVLNLVRNGMEAMLEIAPEERVLTIEAAIVAPAGIEVTVRDNGPGIAPDMAGKIFEAFQTSKPHGVGLGLSICRTVIHSHGGSIWVEPREGSRQGGCLKFTLPAGQPH